MDGSQLELKVQPTQQDNTLWKKDQRQYAFTPNGISIDDAFVTSAVKTIYTAKNTVDKVIDYLRQHENSPRDWVISLEKGKLRIQYAAYP